MTRIDFHTHVTDRLAYACRLTRKAYAMGKSVLILGDTAALAAFDAALWSFSPLEFIPHCQSDSPLAGETPVVLAPSTQDAPHHAILINLGTSVPANFARFERVLEVVSDDTGELEAGRERYRFYRDRGYSLSSHRQGS